MPLKYPHSRHGRGWSQIRAARAMMILKVLVGVLVAGSVALCPKQAVGSDGVINDQAGNTFAQPQEIPNSVYRISVVTTGVNVTQLFEGDFARHYSSERQPYFPGTGSSLFDSSSKKHSGLFSECDFNMDVREALGKNILCGTARSKGLVGSRLGAFETSEREVPLPAAVWIFGFALLGFVFLSNRQHS